MNCKNVKCLEKHVWEYLITIKAVYKLVKIDILLKTENNVK